MKCANLPERVLPSLCVPPIVGEPVGDEPVDIAEREHFIRRGPDSHGGERDVRVRGFLVAVRVAARPGHLRLPPGRSTWLPRTHTRTDSHTRRTNARGSTAATTLAAAALHPARPGGPSSPQDTPPGHARGAPLVGGVA